MEGYGQFCPVSKAMEILDERWTVLVIRELLSGSTRFNELRREVPRMSSALLTARLRSLERAGIVTRTEDGRRVTYALTACGLQLEPVVMGLGLWAQSWLHELGDEDLDPHLLMWDMKRTISAAGWPRGRTLVRVRLHGTERTASRWWIVVAGDDVDICDFDPGFEPAAEITTSLRALTMVWRGDVAWAEAVASGAVAIDAPVDVRRAVPGWIGVSRLATMHAHVVTGAA